MTTAILWIAGLLIVIALIAAVVTKACAVMEDRQNARAEAHNRERLRVTANALRVKRELDIQAFETRQALLRAASNAARNTSK
ncbi:MAG: hypothetical protein JWQ19_589 [Subtercola sp.]|nr:hypothetical protein [Subtercola sp.]